MCHPDLLTHLWPLNQLLRLILCMFKFETHFSSAPVFYFGVFSCFQMTSRSVYLLKTCLPMKLKAVWGQGLVGKDGRDEKMSVTNLICYSALPRHSQKHSLFSLQSWFTYCSAAWAMETSAGELANICEFCSTFCLSVIISHIFKNSHTKFTSIRIFVIKFVGTHSCGTHTHKKKIPVVCDNPASTFIPAVLIEDFPFYSSLIT